MAHLSRNAVKQAIQGDLIRGLIPGNVLREERQYID